MAQVGVAIGTNNRIYAIFSPANDSDIATFPWAGLTIEAAGGTLTVYSLTRTEFDSFATLGDLQNAMNQTTKPGTPVWP